jgi:hypothetical protein
MVALALALCGCEASAPHVSTVPEAPKLPPGAIHRHLLFFNHNLLLEASIQELLPLLKRAAAVGYNGLVLNDSKLSILDQQPPTYFSNLARVRAAARDVNMDVTPVAVNFGYANGLLTHDPNLVEAVEAIDVPFVVAHGSADVAPVNEAVFNGGFEGHPAEPRGWMSDSPGAMSFVDTAVQHSGKNSLRFQDVGRLDPHNGMGRAWQDVQVAPRRPYELSFWVRTKDFTAAAKLAVSVKGIAANGREEFLARRVLGARASQDWTRYSVPLNTLDYSHIRFYVGVWGGEQGTFWLDDAQVNALGLMNLVRRDGCPLTVKGQDGVVYREGEDFLPVSDEKMGRNEWVGNYDSAHEGPTIRLSPQSHIHDGQELLVSYCHVLPLDNNQVSACLTEPQIFERVAAEIASLDKTFEHPREILLGTNEMRLINQCPRCKAQNKSAGELLAGAIASAADIAHRASPGAELYVWSDMFDPNMNAHEGYYLARGGVSDSLKGLPPSVGFFNWNILTKPGESARLFADHGHKQILAAYYDLPLAKSVQWVHDVGSTAGVEGVMYTTFENRYDDLEAFAQAIWHGASAPSAPVAYAPH